MTPYKLVRDRDTRDTGRGKQGTEAVITTRKMGPGRTGGSASGTGPRLNPKARRLVCPSEDPNPVFHSADKSRHRRISLRECHDSTCSRQPYARQMDRQGQDSNRTLWRKVWGEKNQTSAQHPSQGQSRGRATNDPGVPPTLTRLNLFTAWR